MTAARNASPEEVRQQSLALLNQHLAAAVILQDRMRRSPRNRKGANFIMIDDMCDQVASLMETCTIRTADRLHEIGGTVRWPVLLDEVMSENSVRHPSMSGQLVNGLPDVEPLEALSD